MAFTAIGGKTKTTFLQTPNDKISIEFEVAAAQTLKRGQPVKLTTDGKITPWAQADLEHTLLGYCYSDGAAGELVTVITRGTAVIFGISAAAQNAGPVSFASYDTATDINGVKGYSVYAAEVTAAEVSGLALDNAAGANALIRVLLR